jgi:hypothetical protein
VAGAIIPSIRFKIHITFLVFYDSLIFRSSSSKTRTYLLLPCVLAVALRCDVIYFVPDCHYLCAIATISGCRATIMLRQVSQRLSLMIPPSPNVANDYLHGPRHMCIWEVACSSSLCASFLYTFRLEWCSRRLAFFPWISRSVSRCLWNTGNRWEVNEHLCSWVVESTAYEYELFDDIEFCSRITVLVVSAFISHLCYHAGETPVERTCNAVKFIILILFCFEGNILYEEKCGIFCWKGVSCVLESYSTKAFVDTRRAISAVPSISSHFQRQNVKVIH